MDASDLGKNERFTCNGEGEWRIQSCFLGPSCVMVEESTGEKREFGMGGTMAESFVKIGKL